MTKTMLNKFSRRKMLAGISAGAGAMAAGNMMMSGVAEADTEQLLALPLFVFLYFNGGWDALLSLDPRDDTVFTDPQAPLYTGIAQRVAPNDTLVQQALANDPRGFVQPAGSNIAFGPAMGRLPDLYQDLCVVRGMDMGTLTHEVGRRYMITGKFPRGVLPSGSGLPTWVAAQDPAHASIPNLVVGGMETYNEGLDPKATGLAIQGFGDLAAVLQPVNPSLVTPMAIEDAVAAHMAGDSCARTQLNTHGIVDAYRAGWEKSLVVGGGSLWEHFDFGANPASGSTIDQVYDAFQINKANPWNDLYGPKGRAAVAAQAITNNLCQSVSMQLQEGLDHHFNQWAFAHSHRLRAGFNAVADLINYLKSTLDDNGKPYWDRTTLVVFSEFARTPNINAQDGRDHHLANACIVAGQGIAGNQVIGANDPTSYEALPFDFDSQQPASGSELSPIRPADVHATVCQAMNISYEHISNNEPKLIDKMLA